MKSMQIFGARFGNFNSRTRCTRSKYLKPIVIYMLVFVAIVIMPATTKAKNPTAVATTTLRLVARCILSPCVMTTMD
jgi:uncharacterized membrane protein YhaH (DUF805 family)